MKGVRAGSRAAAVLAIAAAIACGGANEERRLASEPALRIWASPIVRWEGDGRRRVEFAIENATNRTVALAAPDPANARVDVYPGPDPQRVCGTAPAAPAEPGPRVALAPGDRVAVEVDLDRACGALPPGEYRYEVSYRAVEPAGEKAFSGTLATRYGQVLVAAPPPDAPRSAAREEAAPQPRRRGRAEPARAGRRGDAGEARPAQGR